MKTGSIKIAGAAAVGVAFAAAAAVPASAAVTDGLVPGNAGANPTAALHDPQQAVGDTVSTVGHAANLTPAGATRALPVPAAGGVLGKATHALPTGNLLGTVSKAAGALQQLPVNAPGAAVPGKTRALPTDSAAGPVSGVVKGATDTLGQATQGAQNAQNGATQNGALGNTPLGSLPLGS